jgi:hypothetical protein
MTTGEFHGAGRLAAPRKSPNAALQMINRALRRTLKHAETLAPVLGHAYDVRLLRYRLRHALGYEPDFRNPRTYNEKLAWRMLYDRNPLIATTTDKVAAREYVAGKVSRDILVPLLGVYDHAAEIPWDALPNQFALKASHGYAMNILVTDKSTVDRQTALNQADDWLTRRYYDFSREWGYRDIRPRLLVEELLVDDEGKIPADVKFLVFHGKTAMIRVHLDRFGAHHINLYDTDLRLMPVRQIQPADPSFVPRPEIRDMIPVAERLAEDFDYARIDLYLVGNTARFGEITHYDTSAQAPFVPPEYDRVLGDMWRLPYESHTVSGRWRQRGR